MELNTANDVLPAPEEKAASVRAMFDRIAPEYDRMNGLMTAGFDRRWRRAVLEIANVGPGDVVVDVACGTGDIGLLARDAGASVAAVDFSGPMLGVAAERGLAGKLSRADALSLPVADGCTDAVTCGFALRNFVSIPPFIAEAARVLKPGGRIVLLEVATPSNALVRFCHGLYFNRIVPLLGALLAERRAYTYLPNSVVYLPTTAELLRMLDENGFVETGSRKLGSGGIQIVHGVLR